MTLALCLVLLNAEPVPVLKLASPGITTVGIETRLATFFGEHLAQQVKIAGADVVTQREMEALLGMERQRQLLGCTDSGSCMAELANALGTDGVLLADIATVGTHMQINIKVITSVDGHTVALFSDTVSSQEAALESLSRGAAQLANQAALALKRSLHPRPASGGSLRPASYPAGIAGIVLAAVGVGLLVASNQNYQDLVSSRIDSESAGRSAQSTGSLEQTLGITGIVVGVVALVAAIVLFVVGAPAPSAATSTSGGSP